MHADKCQRIHCISIHAPHARSDRTLDFGMYRRRISIHAPHARSDQRRRQCRDGYLISIHAPHARSDLHPTPSRAASAIFQSTLLMRGATLSMSTSSRKMRIISIHAPHARSDGLELARREEEHFNPRSSCEERHNRKMVLITERDFNPRSSCEERRSAPPGTTPCRHFNPRSSCEERRYQL